MLLQLPNVLSNAQVAECRKALEAAEWSDGKATAGYLSSPVKDNVQLPEAHPVARKLGAMILDVLDVNQLFISAALPLKVVPPLFNRYSGGQSYGGHIDGAVRPVFGTPHRVRTDLSATLFLSAPEDYDGGELVTEERIGPRHIKLSAGDMVLYPGTSVHHVEPVTRGARLAAFFGFRAWFGTRPSAIFCLNWTPRCSSLAATRRATLLWSGSRAAITICCGSGRIPNPLFSQRDLIFATGAAGRFLAGRFGGQFFPGLEPVRLAVSLVWGRMACGPGRCGIVWLRSRLKGA